MGYTGSPPSEPQGYVMWKASFGVICHPLLSAVPAGPLWNVSSCVGDLARSQLDLWPGEQLAFALVSLQQDAACKPQAASAWRSARDAPTESAGGLRLGSAPISLQLLDPLLDKETLGTAGGSPAVHHSWIQIHMQKKLFTCIRKVSTQALNRAQSQESWEYPGAIQGSCACREA